MKKSYLSICVFVILSLSCFAARPGGGGYSSRPGGGISRPNTFKPSFPKAPISSRPTSSSSSGNSSLLKQKSKETSSQSRSSNPDYAAEKAKERAKAQEEYRNKHPETASPVTSNVGTVRKETFYHSYYGRPAPRYSSGFNDSFNNPYFWMWLMDRPRERDAWIYNHRSEIDSKRFEELKKEDSELEARLAALEANGVKADTSYVPAGIEKDLINVEAPDKPKVSIKGEKKSSVWPWVIGGGSLVLGGFCVNKFRSRSRSSTEVLSKTPKHKEAESFYNPLNYDLDSSVNIQHPYRSGQFKVEQIDQYTRTIGKKKLCFTDYSLKESEQYATLRVFPGEGDDLQIVLLFPDREFDYDAKAEEAAKSGSIQREGDKGEENFVYRRIGKYTNAWETSITCKTRNGRENYEASYWDFSRESEYGEEFYYLTMFKDDGFMRTQFGYKIPKMSISSC